MAKGAAALAEGAEMLRVTAWMEDVQGLDEATLLFGCSRVAFLDCLCSHCISDMLQPLLWKLWENRRQRLLNPKLHQIRVQRAVYGSSGILKLSRENMRGFCFCWMPEHNAAIQHKTGCLGWDVGH